MYSIVEVEEVVVKMYGDRCSHSTFTKPHDGPTHTEKPNQRKEKGTSTLEKENPRTKRHPGNKVMHHLYHDGLTILMLVSVIYVL